MDRVALDLTVLSSPSQQRGIGRYVASLALALSRAAPTNPSLVGITRLGWLGAVGSETDLALATERLLAEAPRLSHAAWAYQVRALMARAVRQLRPSLLHSGHPDATPLGRLGCPRVVTCHDLIGLAYPERYLTWRDGWGPGQLRLDRRRYLSAEHVIAVSRATADDLMRVLEVRPCRISVVHNGIDLEAWSAEARDGDLSALARLGLEAGSYALYVGGADWRKNPEAMCAATAATPDISLVWAGALRPEERARAQAIAAARGLGARLRFTDWIDDATLGALRRGALAELFVSRMEGFGYPVLEAMACGCPVITSNRSSMAEIAGDAAILVDPEDHAALASALAALTRDSAERRRLRDAGVAHARGYGIERMAAETLEVYRAVLARCSRGRGDRRARAPRAGLSRSARTRNRWGGP
ncbi:MAG: glycosyltransferase family 1 protein [Sorangiineae bacterium]|nr:glycosyltransferase family 1 protein [Sorangiineae bacterium]